MVFRAVAVISLLASTSTSPVEGSTISRGGVSAFQIVGSHFHLGNLGLLDFLEGRRGNLSSGRHHRFMRAGVIDALGDPVADQPVRNFPEQLAVLAREIFSIW